MGGVHEGVFWRSQNWAFPRAISAEKQGFSLKTPLFTRDLETSIWRAEFTLHTRNFGLRRPRSAFIAEIEGVSAKMGRKIGA